MDKDILWFAENIYGANLIEEQKEILKLVHTAENRGQKLFINYSRTQGIGMLRNISYGYENWLKDQKITELEAKIADLQQEQIDEMKEHQEALILAKKCIKNLEDQLVESEETIKYLKGIKRYDIGEMIAENTKLKQQLAEWTDGTVICKWTDAENKVKDLEHKLTESDEKVNKQWLQIQSDTEYIQRLQKQLVEKEKEIFAKKVSMEALTTSAKKYQISFAVEKLQQLKRRLRNQVCLMESNEHCYPQNTVCWQDVVQIISAEIKEIKGELE